MNLIDKRRELYLLGNKEFELSNFEKAIDYYQKGLAIDIIDDNDTELIIRILLNKGACYSKLRDYDTAIYDFSQVIDMTRHQSELKYFLIKSLIRRAIVYDSVDEYERGLRDCEDVLKLNPSGNLLQTILKLSRKLQKRCYEDKQKRIEEGIPINLVTSSQTLKLMILDYPTNQSMIEANMYEFKLCIGNEFGLWKRAFWIPPEETVYTTRMICECINLSSVLNSIEYDCNEMNSSGRFTLRIKILDNNNKTNEVLENLIMLRFKLSSCISNNVIVGPVLSLPMVVRSRNNNYDATIDKHQLIGLGSSLFLSCIRELHVNEQTVFVFESPVSLGIGGKVWDSTYVLLEYLKSPNTSKEFIRNKKLLELGCGTGLLGLGLSELYPLSYILTDLDEVIPLVDANIQLNLLLQKQHRNQFESQYVARKLPWGELDAIDDLMLQCDVIVASDVVYDPSIYEPLIQTIMYLLENGNDKQFILAHRHRHPEDQRYAHPTYFCSFLISFILYRFFDMLVTFEIEMTEIQHEISHETDRLGDVHIFFIKLKTRK